MTENLRPYFDRDTFNAGYSVVYRPTVGLIKTDTNQPIMDSVSRTLAERVPSFKSPNGVGISGFGSSVNSSDKNFYDSDLLVYFDYNNAYELLKNLVWSFVKNYLKVLISQPLDITRLVLQVGYFQELDKTRNSMKPHSRLMDESTFADDDSEEEINYFQSLAESTSKESVSAVVEEKQQNPKLDISNSSSHSRAPIPNKRNPHKIQPISKHTIDIMTAIITKDGPFAIFRGINASFIYQTLSHTIEAWITGFLSPFLGIPDPFFLELIRSTDPWKSLWLSVGACVLTGLILMPLDLVRIRLMITQFNKPSNTNTNTDDDNNVNDTSIPNELATKINTRSIRDSMKYYPAAYIIKPPTTISVLTMLHRFSSTIFRKAAPYILFIKYNMDSYSSPKLHTMVNLFSLIMEFFVKLPVENLLRKEQLKFLLSPKTDAKDPFNVITIINPEEDLIVEFNNGERMGDESPRSLFESIKRVGLFDGWRVGVLNVIGFWGYTILKGNGYESVEEKL